MGEKVNIFLTQIGGNNQDLIGSIITITDYQGNIIFTANWEGNKITGYIKMSTSYTISVNNVSGYFTPKSQ